jgi:hypothetical protein
MGIRLLEGSAASSTFDGRRRRQGIIELAAGPDNGPRPRPNQQRGPTACKIGDDVVRVRGRTKPVRPRREDQLEHDGEHRSVLDHFPRARVGVGAAEADAALRVKDHRQQHRQAQHVVEVAAAEVAGEVPGLEEPAVGRVQRKRGEADGVGEVAEALGVRVGHW